MSCLYSILKASKEKTPVKSRVAYTFTQIATADYDCLLDPRTVSSFLRKIILTAKKKNRNTYVLFRMAKLPYRGSSIGHGKHNRRCPNGLEPPQGSWWALQERRTQSNSSSHRVSRSSTTLSASLLSLTASPPAHTCMTFTPTFWTLLELLNTLTLSFSLLCPMAFPVTWALPSEPCVRLAFCLFAHRHAVANFPHEITAAHTQVCWLCNRIQCYQIC